MRSDLERRAETLAESLQETVEPAVQSGVAFQLRLVVARYANREHLARIAASHNALRQRQRTDTPEQVSTLKESRLHVSTNSPNHSVFGPHHPV
jgi:hypothetical protein